MEHIGTFEEDPSLHVEPHPSKETKASYAVCSLRLQPPAEGLGKYLSGSELVGMAASESHFLCPALLGGEALPRLGEALQFSNNWLRCF